MATQAHITKENLAYIVGQLLVNPESVGELESSESFMWFMSDIAQVVSDHCGGEVLSLAEMQDGNYQLEVKRNDSSPGEGLGVWEAEGIWGSFGAGASLKVPALQNEPTAIDMAYYSICLNERDGDGFFDETWRDLKAPSFLHAVEQVKAGSPGCLINYPGCYSDKNVLGLDDVELVCWDEDRHWGFQIRLESVISEDEYPECDGYVYRAEEWRDGDIVDNHTANNYREVRRWMAQEFLGHCMKRFSQSDFEALLVELKSSPVTSTGRLQAPFMFFQEGTVKEEARYWLEKTMLQCKAAGESQQHLASASELAESEQVEWFLWDQDDLSGFKISVSDPQADGSVSFEAEEWLYGQCSQAKTCGSYKEASQWVDEHFLEHTQIRFGLEEPEPIKTTLECKAVGESQQHLASKYELTEPGQSEVFLWDLDDLSGFKISVSDRQPDGSVSFEAEEWRHGQCFRAKTCGSCQEAHQWINENFLDSLWTEAPELKGYRIYLCEAGDDDFLPEITFECQAESFAHAVEQAKDAYPGCRINYPASHEKSFLAEPGQSEQVFWDVGEIWGFQICVDNPQDDGSASFEVEEWWDSMRFRTQSCGSYQEAREWIGANFLEHCKTRFGIIELKDLMREHANLPVTEGGLHDESFMFFPAGTAKTDVLQWFDQVVEYIENDLS